MLTNASGQLWTAAYVNVTGDLPADILSNIAAEQRAKVVYEYLHRQIKDKKVQETIDFLLNREEAHHTMFRECFQRIPRIPNTPSAANNSNPWLQKAVINALFTRSVFFGR